jgi:hypothetical protein
MVILLGAGKRNDHDIDIKAFSIEKKKECLLTLKNGCFVF